MIYAPIVLFVYNRLAHTRRVVEALLKNDFAEGSDLFIFSDAPESEAQSEAVSDVRQHLRQIDGFKSVTIIERDTNFGLARSIIDGVTSVVYQFGRVIVIEDDLVTSPYFLNYMNDALDLYANDDAVISVHGYIYPVEAQLPGTFFIRGADCWGWGTWKRGWDLFEEDGQKLLLELKKRKLTKAFDFNGRAKYSQMLQDQIAGKNDSWAIRWYASAFLKNKLTLYPGKSLVHNIGNDGQGGTHCEKTQNFDIDLVDYKYTLEKLSICESKEARKAIEKFFNNYKKKQRYIKYILPMKQIPFKQIIKEILPPVITKGLKKINKKSQDSWQGDYKSWSDAQGESSGYADQEILDRVRHSLLKVKNGSAAYERDSVLFDSIQYSWPMLAALLMASGHAGKLSVLDFGGSLGSSYYQNKKFLSQLPNFVWSIVEQEHFVAQGKEHFQCENLKFFSTIEECIETQFPNVILVSSVLQYLEKPFDQLSKICSKGVDFLIFDNTNFSIEKRNHLTLQIVPPSIYEASYPCWFFNYVDFISIIQNDYTLIETFDSISGDMKIDGKIRGKNKGLIFKKKGINDFN